MTESLNDAHAYLEDEKARLTESARALHIPTAADIKVPVISDAKRRIMIDWIKDHHGRDLSDEVLQHKDDLSAWLRLLIADLYDDLRAALGPTWEQRMDRVSMDFMPHLESDAFVAGLGEATEGPWAIGINLGLVWVNNAIADALLLASQGRESEARAAYLVAHRVYRAQTQRELHAAWQSFPIVEDAMELEAGAIASVVLRFVALHEMGHAVLGHVGRMEMGVRHDVGRRHYAKQTAGDQVMVRAMEREADLFALQRMIDVSLGPDRMWNNLLFIGAFFRLLAQVETRTGQLLCHYHPPPTERIDYLYQALCERMGPPPNDAWRWAEQLQEAWGQQA